MTKDMSAITTDFIVRDHSGKRYRMTGEIRPTLPDDFWFHPSDVGRAVNDTPVSIWATRNDMPVVIVEPVSSPVTAYDVTVRLTPDEFTRLPAPYNYNTEAAIYAAVRDAIDSGNYVEVRK